MTKAYKTYGRVLVIGKRRGYISAGYLAHGPVTAWWHRNANVRALVPHMYKTHAITLAYKTTMKGYGHKYLQSHWPQVTTYHLARFGHGGVPLLYITADGCALCATCATEQATHRGLNHWPRIVGVDTYYEGPDTYCDHCGATIESAYGDPDAEPID